MKQNWLLTKVPLTTIQIIRKHKAHKGFKYVADALTDLVVKGSKK